MAYTTFNGKDASQATFAWVTQKIGGVDASVLVLDIGGSPLSSGNPMPITAPANLPVAVQGTVPVSVAGNLSTLTPADTATASTPSTATVGTTSAQLKAANGSRKRIDVSNSSTTAQVWVFPGAGPAVVNTGWLLPPQAQATYYTTLALQAISTVAGTAVGLVEW